MYLREWRHGLSVIVKANQSRSDKVPKDERNDVICSSNRVSFPTAHLSSVLSGE